MPDGYGHIQREREHARSRVDEHVYQLRITACMEGGPCVINAPITKSGTHRKDKIHIQLPSSGPPSPEGGESTPVPLILKDRTIWKGA
ncbi:hypothetical protein CEXT_13171 [Caerostris extrusa]|uniref:Uncharacterized protein n=1 Tax=Caerostris extrusa TaxID=172846 RepID=A0AAV4VBY6_CAEEX|nr:hypothetical protein CEXT_13171 [Caerostris extrusa]